MNLGVSTYLLIYDAYLPYTSSLILFRAPTSGQNREFIKIPTKEINKKIKRHANKIATWRQKLFTRADRACVNQRSRGNEETRISAVVLLPSTVQRPNSVQPTLEANQSPICSNAIANDRPKVKVRAEENSRQSS